MRELPFRILRLGRQIRINAADVGLKSETPWVPVPEAAKALAWKTDALYRLIRESEEAAKNENASQQAASLDELAACPATAMQTHHCGYCERDRNRTVARK